MDIVSFETANKLKAAGFQQPSAKSGQVWYAAKGNNKIIVCDSHNNQELDPLIEAGVMPYIDVNACAYVESIIYAPNAIEIIRDGGMTMARLTWMNASDGMDWMCENDDEEFFDKNPAEAAAEAWLAYYKK